MKKISLTILALGCLLTLSSCTEEREELRDANPRPQPSSTVSVAATSSPVSSVSGTQTNLTPSEWRKKNFKPRPFKDFAKLSGYSVVRVLTPQPPTSTTIRSGKKIYQNSCIFCHGATGTPPRRDAALVRYNMADLSQPQQYKFGSGDKALYRSIAYGVDAPAMPPFEGVHTKQEIWDLVNYVRTLQK